MPPFVSVIRFSDRSNERITIHTRFIKRRGGEEAMEKMYYVIM